MTTPNVPQFIDPNNPLLNGGPAKLDTGTIVGPEGKKVGVLTIRTASTTVTVLMAAENLNEWGDLIKDLAASLGGGAKLQAASMMDVAALDTTMQAKRR
jgi:hypothetical protein